jgi:hypothetical protein
MVPRPLALAGAVAFASQPVAMALWYWELCYQAAWFKPQLPKGPAEIIQFQTLGRGGQQRRLSQCQVIQFQGKTKPWSI